MKTILPYNLYDLAKMIYDFIVDMGLFFTELWSWSFTILGETYYFSDILTKSLIAIMALLLVKKLVPLV